MGDEFRVSLITRPLRLPSLQRRRRGGRDEDANECVMPVVTARHPRVRLDRDGAMPFPGSARFCPVPGDPGLRSGCPAGTATRVSGRPWDGTGHDGKHGCGSAAPRRRRPAGRR